MQLSLQQPQQQHDQHRYPATQCSIIIIIIQGLSTLSHSQKWRISRAKGHSVTGGTHDCIEQFLH